MYRLQFLFVAIFITISSIQGKSLRILDETKTSAGTLYLKGEEGSAGIKYLILKGKIIKKYEYMITRIEKKFIFPHSTVLIISEDLGGSGTIPEYHFLEILPGGKHNYSKGFDSTDNTFKAHLLGKDTITVDLGYKNGRRKFANYHNGKLIISSKPVKTGLTEKECKILFDIYLDYLYDGQCKKDVADIIPLSMFHNLYSIQQNPSFNKKLFNLVLKQDCQKRSLRNYKNFSSYICQ
jgi:hypothetical protein